MTDTLKYLNAEDGSPREILVAVCTLVEPRPSYLVLLPRETVQKAVEVARKVYLPVEGDVTSLPLPVNAWGGGMVYDIDNNNRDWCPPYTALWDNQDLATGESLSHVAFNMGLGRPYRRVGVVMSDVLRLRMEEHLPAAALLNDRRTYLRNSVRVSAAWGADEELLGIRVLVEDRDISISGQFTRLGELG